MCCALFQLIDATEDTARAQFCVTQQVRKQTTTFRLKMLAKRIVEPNRIVHVWCSSGKTEGNLFGSEPVRIRESSWTVIEAADASDSTASTSQQEQPMVVMKSVVRMTPLLDTGGSIPEDSVGVLTDICLSSFHQNIAIMHQMIENLILAGAAA